jgi:hypothetical protein
MAAKLTRLPSRLPANSKYVLEIRGRAKGKFLINRFVKLPNGQCIELAARWTSTCSTVMGGSIHSSRSRARIIHLLRDACTRTERPHVAT